MKNWQVVAAFILLAVQWIIILIGLIGWVLNIIKILTVHDDIYWLIGRIIGVVIPIIGAVLGYF